MTFTKPFLRIGCAVLALLAASGIARSAPVVEVRFLPDAAVAPIARDSALVIGRSAAPAVLDGRIEPAEWAAAGCGTFDFNGNPALRTTVLAMYDAENLFLAFHCLEPEAGKIRPLYGPDKAGAFAPDAKGDCDCYNDDSIEVFISPDARQQTVYQFIANTNRAHLDIRYDLPKSDAGYASGFKSAAHVGTDAFSIEFAIPLKAVGLDKVAPANATLRVNFGRNRNVFGQEHAAWQEFWAWQGAMPCAFFAPAAGVALGEARYGPRTLGENVATLSARSASQTPMRLRLAAACRQGDKSATSAGEWVAIQPGQSAKLTAPYRVPRADAPVDLTLTVEGGTAPVALAEQALAPAAPLSAVIERLRFGPADGPGGVFFHANLNPLSLKEYRLRVTLLDGANVAAQADAALTSAAGIARVTIPDAGAKDYAVRLALLDAAGQEAFASEVGRLSWTGGEASKPAAGKLGLKLDLPPSVGKAAGPWPVTVGVPFARGVLTNVAHVRLLSPSGAETPVEVSAPATWDRDRTSIRWLHLRFLANLEDAGKEYTIEYGPDARRAEPVSKLKAAQTDQTVIVDTGRLRFMVSRKPFRFLDATWLDINGDGRYTQDEQVIVPGPNSGLMVETTDGRRYRSDASLDWPDVEKVELESLGPVEAVVRAEGWHKAVTPGVKPERMMKYVVRIVATADSSLLRVFHTFILTETEEVQYRQVTLGFSLADGDTSVSDQDTRAPHVLTEGAEAALVQADHDAWRLQMRTPGRGPSLVSLSAGERGEGRLLVQRKGWGVTLATRDFWQNYAKGYEVRRDGVSLCPWPKDAGAPLSFRPEDVIAPIFVKRLCYTTSGGPGPEGGNFTTYTYGTGTKALGVSKTHEYLLDFTASPTVERSRLTRQLLDDPPLLVVPPAYACATLTMGRIAPHSPDKFPVEEAGLKAMLRRIEYGRPEFRHFGLVNFGESYQSSDDLGNICVYRTFQNAGYGIVNDFYRGYLRSGDRDWFRYAVRRTRHNRDMDHCHYGPKAGGQTEYDTLNWGTVHEVLTFWTHRLFLLHDWYVTGDRRSWDVFLMACEAAARLNPGAGPKDSREMFNQPKELIHMYEATWDPRFLEMAKAIVDGILLAKEQMPADQWPGGSLAMPEYLQPSLLVYHDFTQDPRVLEYLKAYLTHLKGRQNYATGFGQDLAAYLYWRTGEVAWLDLVGGYEGMRDYMRLYETSVPPPVGGLRRKTVTEALQWMATWRPKQKRVFYDGFLDKGCHHTWERFWYFMAAVDDARAKGLLKPYQGPNNPWAEPIWDQDHWKTVPPDKAKEYGWN